MQVLFRDVKLFYQSAGRKIPEEFESVATA